MIKRNLIFAKLKNAPIMYKVDLINPPECPKCKAKLRGVMHAKQEQPTSGQITICLHCDSINVFNDNGNLDIMSEEKLSAMYEKHPKLENAIKKLIEICREVREDKQQMYN